MRSLIVLIFTLNVAAAFAEDLNQNQDAAARAPASAVTELSNSSTQKRLKAYPGGADEDEIKVQTELKPPTLTVDRRSIEHRVLKTYFKKSDEEIIAPGKSDEEMPTTSESE